MSCKNKLIEKFAYSVKEIPYNYPDEILKIMDLISFDMNNFKIMGSARLKSLIFSGDIDGLEIIKYENQAQALQTIIKKIMNYEGYGKDLIIGDIKCGNNKYRDLLKYIGKIKNGKIYNYSPESIRLTIINTHIPELSNLPTKENITLKEWTGLYKFISSFIALRWTPNDILKGRTLINNEFVDLQLAVFNSNTTKIDIYYNYFGKYTEFTNIIFDESPTKDFFIENIKNTILINYEQQNYLKTIKQCFSIARLNNDCKFIESVMNLLVSPINSLNSCKTDLTVLSDMVKFGADMYFLRDKIKAHIGTIILKLSSFYLEDIDPNIFNEINNLINIQNLTEFNNNIEFINKYIENIVQKLTLKYIQNNKININNYFL
jgi:hypothetical protein